LTRFVVPPWFGVERPAGHPHPSFARHVGKAESVTLVSRIRLGGEFNAVLDWLAPPASSLRECCNRFPAAFSHRSTAQRTRKRTTRRLTRCGVAG